MRDIYIATGITDNYYGKAKDFIQSLNNNVSDKIKKVVVTLGFYANIQMKEEFPNIIFIHQDYSTVSDELTEIMCLQHGAFMDVFDKFVKDDDIIIFSDSDVIIQRDLSLDEIDYLYKTFNDNNIGCNNNTSNRTLKTEFNELYPKLDYSVVQDYYKDFDFSEHQVYCTGNVIGNSVAWRKLRNLYKNDIKFIDESFGHYARQQFLMSIIFERDFDFVMTPDTFHSHGCWGLPAYCKYDNNIVYAHSDILLFKHHL